MATLVLSDNEHYILKCILGYVKYGKGDVSSLLNKIIPDEDILEWKDYRKVSFTKDESGVSMIEFKEGEI